MGEEPTIVYGEGATFTRVCPNCGRFVKADDMSAAHPEEPNATCKKCGRVEMNFIGFYDCSEL